MPTPETWHFLGLSVAAGYTTLGAWSLLAPRHAAETFFSPRPSLPESLHAGDIEVYARLLGARDLSIAAALAWCAHDGEWGAVGKLVLAGMGLCVADVWAAWRAKGPARGLVLAAGTAVWGVIGYALVYWI